MKFQSQIEEPEESREWTTSPSEQQTHSEHCDALEATLFKSRALAPETVYKLDKGQLHLLPLS